MGRRGPPKEPTITKLRRGARNIKAEVENRPIPVDGAPEKPECLSGEAGAEWDRLVPRLDRMLELGHVDRNALIILCQAWAQYVDMTRKLEETGIVYINGAGNAVRHPYAIQQKEARKAWERMAREFGLTPAARADLGAKIGAGRTPGNEKYVTVA